MKKIFFGTFLIVLLCGFVQEKQIDPHPRVRNESFKRGEVIEFKMTYGFFTVGKGAVRVHESYHKMNDRYCFRVDVTGKTVGMVDWVADVNDKYGAYIDTASLLPHEFYRFVRQGKYKKDEWTFFDQENSKIEVKSLDKRGNMRSPKYYDAPAHIRDMIGGFIYLRNLDFAKIKINDTINVSGFYEDEFYKLRIVFAGRETIKVKFGKVRAIILKPLMPKNKIFDGENSITAWFSDDKNHIPLKIKAEMVIGSAGVEITSYSNLKNKLNLVKE
jgi:hypothetical protein